MSSDRMRLLPGTGGTVGVTVDGRSVPLGWPEYVAFRWGLAPQGLATRRQLTELGLRPGGAEPVATLTWRHGKEDRFAYLYPLAKAKPKRTPSPAQREALAKALRARRICPCCGRDAGYVLPRSWSQCLDCQDLAAAGALEGGYHQSPAA